MALFVHLDGAQSDARTTGQFGLAESGAHANRVQPGVAFNAIAGGPLVVYVDESAFAGFVQSRVQSHNIVKRQHLENILEPHSPGPLAVCKHPAGPVFECCTSTRRVAPITLDVMWDHFLSRHWSQLSPDFPLQEFTCYAREQVMTILPDSPPRFINLNNYLWSEQWLVRYRDMDFIQSVLNGMASRRPRLDALRDSWYDLDAHYDALETRFWQFYPRMMAQASRKAL